MKLITSIVPHDKGEKLTRAAMESGCRGGTVLMGRSLARSNLAAILGLGESTRDVILMVVSDESADAIMSAIKRATKREKSRFGEAFVTPVGSLVKGGGFREESNGQKTEKIMYEMISVIVNRGYADDVMAAVNARGTAREDDSRFFGMHIVPEKEMLIMIVPTEKKDDVMSAIRTVKCLKEPGMGIAYSSPVESFTTLGKKKEIKK